jgi:16S rRNA (cytosine967-C5)-methyltransferase
VVVRAARAPRPAAGAARSPALASRSAALDILAAVLEGATSLDDALDAGLGKAGPEPRDRAFARSLVATTIRRLGQIDDAIGRLADTARPLRPQSLMQVLRLGAAQLLFLRTPPHAAVGTSVDLADMLGLGRGKGLVNAVLRRLAREGDAILAEQDAARLNTPDWLWRRWTDAYGEAAARAIALQHMVEPPLDLTLKPSEAPLPWAEALSADIMPNGTLRRTSGGRIQDMPGFAQGAWWVQDLAAALPAGLFGDVRGLKVLDLCAAPGGKTAQLAAAGASVTAVDRSPGRLAMVRDNLQRLGLTAELVTADALAWAPPAGATADAVLLDAPCLATGTIRRHPDVALAKRPQDLAQLTRLQAELLGQAWTWLRPGGTLVYCTCSLEPEEGELQIERFLAGRPEMARRPIEAAEIGGLGMLIGQRGDLRSLPFHLADQGGMDGFFAARLVRRP